MQNWMIEISCNICFTIYVIMLFFMKLVPLHPGTPLNRKANNSRFYFLYAVNSLSCSILRKYFMLFTQSLCAKTTWAHELPHFFHRTRFNHSKCIKKRNCNQSYFFSLSFCCQPTHRAAINCLSFWRNAKEKLVKVGSFK